VNPAARYQIKSLGAIASVIARRGASRPSDLPDPSVGSDCFERVSSGARHPEDVGTDVLPDVASPRAPMSGHRGGQRNYLDLARWGSRLGNVRERLPATVCSRL